MAPAWSVISMVKEKNASHFPIGVILAQASQNVACSAYGIQIANEPFFLSSSLGLVFQLVWITVWYTCVRLDLKSAGWRTIHPVIASLLLTILMTVIVYVLSYMNKDLVGLVCVIMSFLLCVSPLATLGLVVRSRNSASIPFVMSFVMLLSNAAWAVYGIVLEDAYVTLPSIFGFIITVFQVLVSAWCNGILFYDLTFLQVIYSGYQPVEPIKSPQIVATKRTLTPMTDLELQKCSD